MMTLGVTGTQKGATEAQLRMLYGLMERWKVGTIHHGDCIGADQQVHKLAIQKRLLIVIHPPRDEWKRAFCGGPGMVRWPSYDYLTRNKHIVQSSDQLVALPSGFREEQRSGTWATVRYALKNDKKVSIIWPSGVAAHKVWWDPKLGVQW